MPQTRVVLPEDGGPHASEAPSSQTLRRVISGVVVGNFMEWYDYAIYGFMAITMAAVFFPGGSSSAGLISTFAVWGVGYLARPVGGLFLGPLGDKVGRRTVLSIVIIGMGAATTLIGLLPSRASAGLWAPALLVLLRLIQGFSAAGEFGTGVAFLAEYAPARRRGLVASVQATSSSAALLTGALFVLALRGLLSPEEMISWGWRIPFLASAPLALGGLFIRLRLQETPAFRALEVKQQAARAPFREVFSRHRFDVVRIFALVAIQQVVFYVILVYLQTYLTASLGFSSSDASVATVCTLLVAIITVPSACALSDRVGRRPLVISACIGFAVLTYPIFVLMGSASLVGVIALEAVLAIMTAVAVSVLPITGLETVPTRVRVTAFTVPYNISGGVFGGPALVAITALIAWAGTKAGPALYIIPVAVLSLLAALTLPETRGRSFSEMDAQENAAVLESNAAPVRPTAIVDEKAAI